MRPDDAGSGEGGWPEPRGGGCRFMAIVSQNKLAPRNPGLDGRTGRRGRAKVGEKDYRDRC